MRVLITGAAGFLGGHAVRRARQAGATVFGAVWRRQGDGDREVRWLSGDLTERAQTEAIFAEAKPDVVFHFADPALDARLGGAGTARFGVAYTALDNVLTAVRGICPAATVILPSSSAVYGQVLAPDIPIREDRPVRPVSHHGIAKAAQELLASYSQTCFGLRVVVVRIFNVIGPGQSEAFLASSVARQLAEIEAERLEPVLTLGDLSPIRDFVDVRDVVDACWRLAEARKAGEIYNVCTGVGHPVRALVDGLCSEAGMSSVRIVQSPALGRSCDIQLSIGNREKLGEAIAWEPQITLRQTLRDLLLEWRGRTRPAGQEVAR